MLELDKINIEFKIGEEHLGDIEEISLSGTIDTPENKRAVCMRQSRVPNRYAQVILTRSGQKPLTISKDGNALIIPVIKGNIVAQAKMSADHQTMVIRCTTIGGVNGHCLLLDSGTESVFESMNKSKDKIKQACYYVICGNDFAYFKRRK